ncbi:hypothetical protein, partial [Salinispora arenicola]|uniref:hypothetical protein n=1 Tax=Salinispora arenicola TaxID=168697 RepID=UPI0027DDC4C0
PAPVPVGYDDSLWSTASDLRAIPGGRDSRIRGAVRGLVGPMIRVGRYRRFTANRTLHLDIGARRLFIKINPNPVEAAAEATGYRRIRDHYRLPTLRAHSRIGHWTISLYDRHQPDLPDTGLLLDALAAANAGEANSFNHGLDRDLQHYTRTIGATIRRLPASSTVSKLYHDRARPHGRLDHYYGRNPILLRLTGADSIRCADLRETTLMVNGQPPTAGLLRPRHRPPCRPEPRGMGLGGDDPG